MGTVYRTSSTAGHAVAGEHTSLEAARAAFRPYVRAVFAALTGDGGRYLVYPTRRARDADRYGEAPQGAIGAIEICR